MLRRLRELDRIDAATAGQRRAGRRLRRHPRPRRENRPDQLSRSHGVVVAVGVALICFGAWKTGTFTSWQGSGGTHLAGSYDSWPDRPSDAQDAPLGQPPKLPDAGGFAFMATQKGSTAPVTYDACAPIHLVVNPRTEIRHGATMLKQAIAEVSKASGLAFVIDGHTDEAPSQERELLQKRYGDGWAPALVAWTDPDEASTLAGSIAGVGGSATVVRDGRRWNVTGSVRLDGPQLARISKQAGGWADARAVVMHELAHLVGLAHVEDTGELMQPKGQAGRGDWGPGDRTGLAKLGSGPCIDY